MSKIFRAGVIGCGAIAERHHIPDYVASPDAEVVALCDKNIKVAKAVAAKLAPDARVYSDYKKMLKETDLDGVTVALPNFLHEPVTLAALKAGCHVMVEKPMAASPAEARRMIAAAKKAGKTLMVNQNQRRDAVHRKAREVVESGILGKILHVSGMFGHSGPDAWSPSGKWFFIKDQAVLGAMADLGVHKADLIRFVTGKEVAEISAYTAQLDKKGSVEDNFVSCLTFTDGTVGTLCASWTAYGTGVNYLILHGTKGTLKVNVEPDRPLVANLIQPICEIVFDPMEPLNDYPGTWGMDVSGGFVRAAMGLEEPYCSGEEGAKSLDIIFAALKSAKTGKSVKL
jgi:UDP-N-acetylglucosamine 3-dehydrogenase